MSQIDGIKLKNNGWFVAKIQIEAKDTNTDKWESKYKSGDITVFHEKTVKIGDVASNLANNSTIRLKVLVVAGDNNTSEEFIYKNNCDNTVIYKIEGTTKSNTLTQIGFYKNMLPVGHLKLDNKGAFVARLTVLYKEKIEIGGNISYDANWKKHENKKDIWAGNGKEIKLEDTGIKEGSQIKLRAYVVAGDDRDSDETYIYNRTSKYWAKYAISGMTKHSNLEKIYYKEAFQKILCKRDFPKDRETA